MKRQFFGKDVIMMTCSDCNTRCRHCYISYKGNMQKDELDRLVCKWKQQYNVSLNGTEVIIHPEYFEALEAVGQKRIMTNGIEILRNPSILKKLRNIGVQIISISYHIGIHDSISAVNEQTIKEVIRLAKLNSLRIRLMVTVNKYNYMHVEKICEQAIKLGADSIRFTNFVRLGNAIELPDNSLTNEQINEFLELIQKVRNLYDKTFLEVKRCGTFGKGNSKIPNNFMCPAGTNLVAITPDMSVYPCNFLAKPGYEIGKVENGIIYITKKIHNDGNKCIAKEVYNNGEHFSDYFLTK